MGENGILLDGVEIINIRHDREHTRRVKYAGILHAKHHREGMTFDEAYERMFDRNYFGMMMVETGEADSFITGVITKYTDAIKPAIEIVGMREGLNHIAGINIVNKQTGHFLLCRYHG